MMVKVLIYSQNGLFFQNIFYIISRNLFYKTLSYTNVIIAIIDCKKKWSIKATFVENTACIFNSSKPAAAGESY